MRSSSSVYLEQVTILNYQGEVKKNALLTENRREDFSRKCTAVFKVITRAALEVLVV